MTQDSHPSPEMWDGSEMPRARRDTVAHSDSTPRRAAAVVGTVEPPPPKERISPGDFPFPPGLLDPVFHYEIPSILKQETATHLHPHLLATARIETQIERTIGWLLHRLNHGDRVQRLGHARLSDYVRERLGISVRRAQMLIRLAKELERLPRLARAHALGDLKTSKVYCLLGVVRPENEVEWIERSRSMTVRKLKEAVREERKKQAVCSMPGMQGLHNSMNTDDSSDGSSSESLSESSGGTSESCSAELDAKLEAMLQETIDKMDQSCFRARFS